MPTLQPQTRSRRAPSAAHTYAWIGLLALVLSACSNSDRKPRSSGIENIVFGFMHTCAQQRDGTLKCWGNNRKGQIGNPKLSSYGTTSGETPAQLSGLDLGGKIQAIAAAGEFSCALLQGDRVKCWGDNDYGQLGQGDTDNYGDNPSETLSVMPSLFPGAGTEGIVLGETFACVWFLNSEIKCWGRNSSGQLGQGNADNYGDNPSETLASLGATSLGGVRRVTALSAGWRHTCALLDDGTLKCWGENSSGQLGQGNADNYGDNPLETLASLGAASPGGGRRVTALSAGARHTCVLLDDKTIKCWGDNASGQLGLGHTTDYGGNAGETLSNLSILNLGSGRSVTALSTGARHTCVLLDNGTLKCWGDNRFGMLGLGHSNHIGDDSNENLALLPALNLGAQIHTIYLGTESSCAATKGGQLKCWGGNVPGSLGLGHNNNIGDDPSETGAALPLIPGFGL